MKYPNVGPLSREAFALHFFGDDALDAISGYRKAGTLSSRTEAECRGFQRLMKEFDEYEDAREAELEAKYRSK